MNISDPKLTMYIGIGTTIAQAVGQGTVHLTNMFPAEWIPAITAWMAFLGMAGTAVMSASAAVASSKQSIITNAATLPEVKSITLDSSKPATPSLNLSTPENVKTS